MKKNRLIFLLFAFLALLNSAHSQVILRLNGDDTVIGAFWTDANLATVPEFRPYSASGPVLSRKGLMPAAPSNTVLRFPGSDDHWRQVIAGSGVTITQDDGAYTLTISSSAGAGTGDMLLGTIQTVTAAKTFNDGTLKLAGATSGFGVFHAPAIAGTSSWTLPAGTGTLLFANGDGGGLTNLTSANLSGTINNARLSGVLLAANNLSDLTNVGTAQASLSLVPGVNVQAYSGALALYSAISPTSNVQTLLGAANYAAFKSSLSLDLVQNIALSTWPGTASINTVGTLGAGTASTGFTINLSNVTLNGTMTGNKILGGSLGAVNGSAVTNINSTNITGSHGLPDGVLSTNVPLLSAGSNLFSGSISATGNNFFYTSNPAGPSVTVVAQPSQSGDVFVVEDNSDADKITVDKDINLNLNGNKIYGVGNGGIAFSGTGAVDTLTNLAPITDSKTALAEKPLAALVSNVNISPLSGEGVIDSITTSTSVVLLTAQSIGSQNGYWITSGGAWTRPTWYANGNTAQAFAGINGKVTSGFFFHGSCWRMTTPDTATIGTTATSWVILKPSSFSYDLSANVAQLDAGAAQTFVAEVDFSGLVVMDGNLSVHNNFAMGGVIWDGTTHIFDADGIGTLSAWTIVGSTFQGSQLNIGTGGTNITKIKTGTSVALVGGSKVVTETTVTANSRFFFSTHTRGTITRPAAYDAATRSVGASFTITSSDATDTSTVDWIMIEP